MSRQRDYQAEYRRRIERATKAGLTKAQGYGKARRGAAAQAANVPTIAELRAAGRLPQPRRRLGGGGQRVERMIGRQRVTVTSSTDPDDIRRALERARGNKSRVVVRFLVATEKGTRTVTLDGRGRRDRKRLPPLVDGRPAGQVTVTEYHRGR